MKAWHSSLLWFALVIPAMAASEKIQNIVVIGKLSNQDYQHVEIEGDWLGHGWITANLHVKRFVIGKAPTRDLKVQYFGHSYLREDISFRFRLRLSEDGVYQVCAPNGRSGFKCR